MAKKASPPVQDTQCKKGLALAVEKVVTWSRLNSPWVIHYNSGSCNGCDIELLEVITPCHDVERFGVKLQGSPRHADVLIVTGAVTMQSRERLLRTYEQMPGPKFVMALGSCGISGGVFHDCYAVMGGVDKVIPVDVYVPGCPPRPEAIMFGVVQLLNKLKGVKDPDSTHARFFEKVSPGPAEPVAAVAEPVKPAEADVKETAAPEKVEISAPADEKEPAEKAEPAAPQKASKKTGNSKAEANSDKAEDTKENGDKK